jgi:DsbC/DsbD-like thiol-disulfide interchange protein
MHLRLSLLALGLAAVASDAHAAADPGRYMSAVLIAESLDPEPGSTVLVGIQMRPRPGWHGYWSNPGDSGIPPNVRWIAPEGISLGPLMHPAPTLLTADGISSFVHEGAHLLLSKLSVRRTVAAGTAIPVKAELNWAACTATQCVPLRTTLSLELTAGSGAKAPGAAVLRAAEHRLPKRSADGTFFDDGKRRRLILPASVRLNPEKVRFFPDSNENFSTAQGEVVKEQGKLAIVGPSAGAVKSISGVVRDNSRAWRISFLQADPGKGRGMAAIESEPVTKQSEGAKALPSQPNPPPPAASQTDAKSSLPLAEWMWIAVAAVLLSAATYLVRRRRA